MLPLQHFQFEWRALRVQGLQEFPRRELRVINFGRLMRERKGRVEGGSASGGGSSNGRLTGEDYGRQPIWNLPVAATTNEK
jgi:hypothetical protein